MELYHTAGTCAKQILFEVKNNILTDLKFAGGCGGNLCGIAAITKGMHIEDIVSKFKGIPCRNGTSCPDQLAQALQKYQAKMSAV